VAARFFRGPLFSRRRAISKTLHERPMMFHDIWISMFHVELPVVEKILRPVLVYAFLVVGLRLAGKRELAQLNPFDLIVLLTLSNTVQNAIIGNDNSLLGGLIGATTLLAVNMLVVRFLYSHDRLDRLVEGRQDVLMDRGKVRMDRLKKEMITLPELEAAAHRQGFGSLAEVDRAVLETGGSISFVGRKPAPEEARHAELLERLDRLQREVVKLGGARS
jgi:uncharacterized membrane protein YcaP (DUF421 family)